MDTLEQPSAYGKQPESVGATGTGPVVRPWKDCPKCNGGGWCQEQPLGSRSGMGRLGVAPWGPPTGEYTREECYSIDCPTCAAHWAGVDEAVTEYDRRLQAAERKAEQAERITSDLLPGSVKGDR